MIKCIISTKKSAEKIILIILSLFKKYAKHNIKNDENITKFIKRHIRISS